MTNQELIDEVTRKFDTAVAIPDAEFKEAIFDLILWAGRPTRYYHYASGQNDREYRRAEYDCGDFQIVVYSECGMGFSRILCGYIIGNAERMAFYREPKHGHS